MPHENDRFDPSEFTSQERSNLRHIERRLTQSLDDLDTLVDQFRFRRDWSQRIRVWATVWSGFATIFLVGWTMLGDWIKNHIK